MDIVTQAMLFATQKHVLDNHQLYGGVLPYTHHPAAVERVLINYGWQTDENIRAAAWLHDVIEDTRGKPNEVRVSDLEELFGDDVAALVSAVTCEDGPNRKTRNALTYPKIRAAGPRACALKLADRIANVYHGVVHGGRILQKYRQEQADFRHNLWHEGYHAQMWEDLKAMLDPEATVMTPAVRRHA